MKRVNTNAVVARVLREADVDSTLMRAKLANPLAQAVNDIAKRLEARIRAEVVADAATAAKNAAIEASTRKPRRPPLGEVHHGDMSDQP